MITYPVIRSCLFSLTMLATAMAANAALAGPAETAFLNALSGDWIGNGRAATSQGEAVINCDVRGNMRGQSLSLRADCRSQGQSGSIGMSLYHSDMSRQFHGQLLSPLRYISGGLIGNMSRGDVFLRLAADDGSEGRLLFVEEGPNQIRLLVTTIVEGSNITVLDLPLVRAN